MRLLASLLLLTLLLSITPSLWGQSSEEGSADDPAGTQAPPADDDAAAVPEGEQTSEEVFIPTEEISEDFAVSFPVDI